VEERYAKKMAAHRDELETMRKARNRDGVSDLLEKLLDQAKMEVDDLPETAYEFNQEQIRAYRIYGGAPWLDGSYTIFGEVVEGMKIVLEIEKVKTGAGDKPLRDIRITKASIVE
jgi:peptidyl-prolyl cis-trans isomerase B (cyclophilin B)